MRTLSKSDRQFWKDYGIDPGVPSSNGITTEQLGEALLQTVQSHVARSESHFQSTDAAQCRVNQIE